MSEKWRALNSTSGNVHGLTQKTVTATTAKTSSRSVAKLQNMASNHNNSGSSSSHIVPHIGAPTLISTTLQQLPPPTPTPTPTTPTPQSMAGGDGNISSTSHSPNTAMLASGAAGSDTESNSTDYNAGAGAGGALSAGVQLNFHLLTTDAGTAGDGNSIMNSSQISGNSNESMQLSSSPAAVGGGAAIAGKSGGGKHLTAHSVAGVSANVKLISCSISFLYSRLCFYCKLYLSIHLLPY